MVTLQNYKDTCGAATWKAMMTYAEKLRHNDIRIAFFSSTPQGGGVALMRHALVRFARLTGVHLAWYGKQTCSAANISPQTSSLDCLYPM